MINKQKAVVSLKTGETGFIVDTKTDKEHNILYHLVHIILTPFKSRQYEVLKDDELTNYN